MGFFRRDNQEFQDRVIRSLDHQAITANFSLSMTRVARRARVERVMYNLQAGLAPDATNHALFEIVAGYVVAGGAFVGGRVVAAINTNSASSGHAILVNSPFVAILATDSTNLVLAADEHIGFRVTRTGAPTIGLGRVEVEMVEI